DRFFTDPVIVSVDSEKSGFATTHWSVVLAAAHQPSPEAERALAALSSIYWYPLYAFARRRLGTIEDAQDLTQEFFARLLEKNSLRFADRQRGRFRSFLLASFKNFLAQERDRANAQKRGGGKSIVTLDFVSADRRYDLEPADRATPEAIYERHWALELLGQVFARLREEHKGKGKGELFQALKPILTGGEVALSYAQLGASLGMAEGAVKVAAHRLRKRYGELLRETIAETVSGPDEIDDELRQLF